MLVMQLVSAYEELLSAVDDLPPMVVRRGQRGVIRVRPPALRRSVSSYYVEPAGLLIDPLVPREGLEWFEGRRRPEQVGMTIRHHLRDGERFAEALGCELRCHVDGLHEFVDGPDVRGFDFGDELAPGVTALEVDAISPEETALHIEHGGGAIAFGDGLTRPGGGPLRFVPDFLIGDDPERVKRELASAFDRLLELDFEALLFAHGEPLVGEGKQALRRFVAAQGRARPLRPAGRSRCA